MFYSQFILAKKGPLGTIWIAAHLERKLRKNQVADTDIGVSVDSILSPDVPIALRLSSHLLLGVVRIYNRKVNYLFDDCSEALLKVKQAFRSTAVDLPPEQSKAPYHSITLPETFDLDDFELPDNDAFQGNYVDHHVSSRDQITLQDTMDGVALSTSRFGLDERFGDADTSGVDLDEELFLNKVGTSGDVDVSVDPQSSVQVMAPIKHDDHDVVSPNLVPMIDGVQEDVDLLGDAQAPRTPGLLEEPYLSNAQERSACEDHFETEERHLTEAKMVDDLEKISGEKNSHDQNKHVDDFSVRDINSVIVTSMASEDGHHSSDLDVKKLQGVASEKSLDYHASASEPSSHVENHVSSVSELAELRHEEIGHNKTDNVGLGESTYDSCGSANISLQVLQNVPTSSENIENVDVDFQEKEEDQTCKEPTVLNLDSNSSIVDEQHQVLVKCKATQGSNLTGQQCVDPKPFNENGTPSPVPVFGAGDILCGVSQGNDVLDGTENAALEGTSGDPALEGLSHGAGGMSSAVDNAASVRNPIENVISGSPDLLAPEKLRSVTDGDYNHPGSLAMDYTPGYLARNNDSDAGSNFISGKKRTYTESTLTEQSLYTVESSGISHSKRTVESVPDDGDLLSSILAGRRTSVLKVKPTPSPLEMTSVKRRRSAGLTKRKVLIDDSMVLHGDTIRRQLMNTEDIRRVRKKAPCTRPEISMIQKQYLAEEMFLEPICSGLSTELASLHNQTHDLSGIAVSVDDFDRASLEPGTNGSPKYNNDMPSTEGIEGSSAQEVMGASEKGGEDEGLLVQDICEQKIIDAPVLVDAQNADYISSLQDNAIESKSKATTDVEENQSLLEIPDGIADTELDGRLGSVTDVVNTSAGESSLPSELVSGDYADISANLAQVAPSYEARTPDLNIIFGDATWHNDLTDLSKDQKADEVSFEETPTCEIGDEGKDMGEDFGNVTAVEFVPDKQLLETAEGNPTVETEACINTREMEYAANTTVDKEAEQMSLFPMGTDLHMEDVLLDGGKFPCQEDGDFTQNMAAMDHLACDYAGVSGSMAANETEFLNFDDEDDDELVEAADDHMPNKDAIVTDNSGWSSRTRAVANYLQGLFVKQGGNTRRTLTMDTLLVGKTRKEASRMFFEALVLKTKDYLDVEQTHPFDNISLRPQPKLLKSEF